MTFLKQIILPNGIAEISLINNACQGNHLIDDIIHNDNLFYDDHSD